MNLRRWECRRLKPTRSLYGGCDAGLKARSTRTWLTLIPKIVTNCWEEQI